MFMPELFAVTDPDEVDFVLANARLGCLVTRDAEGFFGTHLPMLFDRERRVLAGHVARGNPHPARGGDGEALVVFQGMDAYVSPSWYPSKFQHGKVVPTWNYEVAHVTGRASWHTDVAWIREHLGRLTNRFEGDRDEPWGLDDAPEDYLQGLFKGVVGVEVEVREVQVKRKLSQNRAEPDRVGVIAGLLQSADAGDREVGAAMAKDGRG
jgi:transcriptional regulator